MDAGIGAKATVLDCMVGDCEGICASLQACHGMKRGRGQGYGLGTAVLVLGLQSVLDCIGGDGEGNGLGGRRVTCGGAKTQAGRRVTCGLRSAGISRGGDDSLALA
jgi:hypothetical protein